MDGDKIPDLYLIKCRKKDSRGPWKYGVVDKYGERAEEMWRDRRYLTVEDAIRGTLYHVPYHDFEIVDVFKDNYGQEFNDYVEKAFKRAQERAAKATTMKGKMFATQQGDGYAYYVVTSENKDNTVNIQWRGFSLDRWIDPYFGAGGKFIKANVQRLTDMYDGMLRMRKEFAAEREKETA